MRGLTWRNYYSPLIGDGIENHFFLWSFENTQRSKHFLFEFSDLNVIFNGYLIGHLLIYICCVFLWGVVFLFVGYFDWRSQGNHCQDG